MPTNNLSRTQAQQINFQALLNSYCREFSNWSQYEGLPKYDAPLAAYIALTGYTRFIRFDFSDLEIEIFAPLDYYSMAGVHQFGVPVFSRQFTDDDIRELTADDFLDITALYAKQEYPNADANYMKERLANSISNLTFYLDSLTCSGRQVNIARQTFIEAEQSLVLGHSVHPLTKSREGFDEQQRQQYSPETNGKFQLHYFLIHPDCIIEKCAEDFAITDRLRENLQSFADPQTKILLAKFSEWKVVPTHPWEADYLLQDKAVQTMQQQGLLQSVGLCGPTFTATSSVRTVYSAESEWMYKFSLHVKITNSFRVNYLHELNRGYEAALLMRSKWGKDLKQAYPEIHLITDPAYIAVRYGDQIIEGFSTSIRQNPFTGEAAERNIGLVASLTQDSVLGNKPRITQLIEEAAELTKSTMTETAITWFNKYLTITIAPLIGVFNTYGFGSEFHQQNILLEMDENLFPKKIYFRDNQGYFFRQGKAKELAAVIPRFGGESRSFIAEPRMINFWGYYLIINNIFGIISALGKNGLASEPQLIEMLYQAILKEAPQDKTGLTAHLLNSSKLVVKGNLLTNLLNMDEASAPRTDPAVYRKQPNPLNTHFYSSRLLQPTSTDVAYRRYFEKEDVTITLRPVDLDRDVEMLHEWFHREHAIKIWKMNWSLRELERYYRLTLAGNSSHSYIGEANGVPTFNIEVYWASRDIVGNYYDVMPSDYGTHQFIAPTDPKLKYASPSTRSMMDFVFSEPRVGKMIGEGAVDSMASMMNKAHVGFKIEKVIEMPHKKANLNFCYREWYWNKFPEAAEIAQEEGLILTKNN